MDWLIVKRGLVRNAARFMRLTNYPDNYKLSDGVPLRATYPDDVELRMDPDSSNDIELVESLYGSGELLIVDESVTQLLDSQGVRNVELLPVRVLNHKGKVVKRSYFVLNILSVVDCIDLEKSVFQYNSINPSLMSEVDQLVLDPARLPTGIKLFRPKHLEPAMLMHRSLQEALDVANARGFLFQEIDEYAYP